MDKHVYLAPIACWTSIPAIGYTTDPILVNYGFMSEYKTDSTSRPKPRGVEMLRQGTSVVSIRSERIDHPIVVTLGEGDGTQIVHSSVCQFSGGAGLGGSYEWSGSNMEEIVRNKLRAKTRDSSVNLAQAMAEFRQTASLFSAGAKYVAGAARVLMTRNPKLLYSSIRDVNRGLSNLILEVQYGVRPLCDDIISSIDVLKDKSSRPMYSRAFASHTERVLTDYPGFDDGGEPIITSEVAEKRVTGWSFSELRNEFLHTTLGQFGFTNPLSLGYELIPFSFVVDWWFSIGESLASLDNSLYFGDSICQMSSVETFRRETTVRGSTGHYKHRQSSRGNVGGLGTFSPPVYKPSSSLQHILNGTALLGQFTSRTAPRR